MLTTNWLNAAKNNDVQTIENLIKSGWEPNSRDHDGWTSLHVAAWNGHSRLVEILLSRGADINSIIPMHASQGAGDTALILAAWQGHRDIVQILLSLNADTTVVPRSGYDALRAARFGAAPSSGCLEDLEQSTQGAASQQ